MNAHKTHTHTREHPYDIIGTRPCTEQLTCIDVCCGLFISLRRRAYAFPASHFAPTGDTGADSPWMGMRVRLRSSYNCSQLQRTARIVCVALQTYGGIFADNGSPWFFSGEASDRWAPYLNEIEDIKKIPSTLFDVVDPGGEAETHTHIHTNAKTHKHIVCVHV